MIRKAIEILCILGMLFFLCSDTTIDKLEIPVDPVAVHPVPDDNINIEINRLEQERNRKLTEALELLFK